MTLGKEPNSGSVWIAAAAVQTTDLNPKRTDSSTQSRFDKEKEIYELKLTQNPFAEHRPYLGFRGLKPP
jgi:hypothetical protein